MLSTFSMHKKKLVETVKKYTDRSINEVYSKILCQFSNTNGIAGKNGRRGIIGNKGAPGNKGDIGNYGDKGYQGNIGLYGNMGIFGDNGNLGLKGDEGDIGNIGDKGNVGGNGNIGLLGGIGLEGLLGEVGDLGNIGNSGLKGDTGKISLGNKGEFGEKGEAGAKGNSLLGETGEKGEKGDIGEVTKGSSGNVGDFGDKGILGENGDKGNIGSQGDQGVIGGSTDVFAFANNTRDSIDVNLGATNLLYYPSNNLSSGIVIFQGFIPRPSAASYTVFFITDINKTYLITYDLKANATITTHTNFSIVDKDTEVPYAGSVMRAPSGYISDTFISFSRVFLAQPNSANNFVAIVYDSSVPSISLLGGINGPQISIIQIA